MIGAVLEFERDLACESTLLPILRQLHEHWLADVRNELGPALHPAATSWQRFSAIRYLDTVFQPRLHREAEVVSDAAFMSSPRRSTSLQATAQMLDLLRLEIGELSQSPLGQQLVPPLLHALVQQLERWCADVEVALGWIRRDTLAPELLERFLVVSETFDVSALG